MEDIIIMQLWDLTGFLLLGKGVEMVGVDDKSQITAFFCGSLMGDFLPIPKLLIRKHFL